MKKLFHHGNRVVSFRRIVALSMSAIAVPILIFTILFNWYSIQQQQSIIQDSRRSTLSIYRSQLENAIQLTENFVSDTINNRNLDTIIYSKSRLDVHLASYSVAEKCKILLKSYSTLGGFYIYSAPFDYYRLTYLGSYPQKDLNTIRAAVIAAVTDESPATKWTPLTLSDRTVLFYTYVRKQTVIAAMVDPSLQSHSNLTPEDHIFYVRPDGSPYKSNELFQGTISLNQARGGSLSYENNGRQYVLTTLPCSKLSGYIVYASPYVSIFQQMTSLQKLLFFITLCLSISIPLCWMLFFRWFIKPMHLLADTARSIQEGNLQTRVPQKSNISEVREIIGTINSMLDTINQQQAAFYEQQMEIQHAQLQYLQLQIRPHFFLNCLNMIYSMAGENKVSLVQELTLEIADYLRSIFKDGSKLISLNEEVHAAEAYIRIQQIESKTPPKLTVSIDAAAASVSVPPFSILTFVENAIKHSRLVDTSLEISVRCIVLQDGDGDYLNIRIHDNGGGFSQEQLELLNRTAESVYTDKHVGISNIRARLKLLYGDKATLCFMNLTDGACVDVFVPLRAAIPGGSHHDNTAG